MILRLVIVATGLAALLAAGAASGDPGAEKHQVDERIGTLRERVAEQEAREGILTEELSAAAGRVRELEAGVQGQGARLGVLEQQLASARARLARLETTFRDQSRRLERLRREHRAAIGTLERRVRAIYLADEPNVLSFVLGTTSFTDLIDNLELLGRIGRQDKRIVERVASARAGLADARRRTAAARDEAAELERGVAARTSEQRAVVARLATSRDALLTAQAERRAALGSIEESQEEVLAEIDALEAQSAALAAAIRAAQAEAAAQAGAPAAAPVVGGGNGILSWPVSGPVTSGFGPRWGRMHEGIDIAVPTGTPVGASAPGTVIYAGWLGGYGNLVVVDHGNGLSTAYAHNSTLLLGVGASVGTGTTVALSGNTGNSSGPHVHFEVRVGGSAVDPLGYL
jgi:murein DD-endopeptidase MepM/ murein hydrolase activator NlpD